MNTKTEFISIFRDNGFNCFPIPRYADSIPEQKAADYRYKADKTETNQTILDGENYGVIAMSPGSCIIDFDHKEHYRKYVEEHIANGFMAIETPHGWHIPITGFTGDVHKVMLYDKNIEPDKQIVEIQGPKHYVIGADCDVFDAEEKTRVFYENRGTNTICNAKGLNFDDFVDKLCKKCKVHPKTVERSANYNMRKRFKEGKLPTPGTSNNYFFNAALVCHSDELDLTIEQALEKIRIIFDQWKATDDYSGRTWENIENKIKDAYELDPLHEGRPKKDPDEDFALTVAQSMLVERKIYSDQTTREIFENKNGYLENITDLLHKELQQHYNEMSEAEFKDFKFKMIGLAPDIPQAHKNLKVFDNGVFDTLQHKIIETDKLAEMGFKGYNYLPELESNFPEKFHKVIFTNVPEHEHPRIKAALRAALTPKLDPRISVIHGMAGVGKTLGMTILFKILCKYEQYAMTVELSQLLTDKFIKAHIKGKTLLVISELPETYTDFAAIKALTGEEMKTERGFYSDSTTFENKLKIIGTTNYLAKIPEKEKNAMYGRRLSLIHNTRELPYEHNAELADEIIEEEGEKIISWILNLPEKECVYESSSIVKAEWENLSSPELEYMQKCWKFGEASTNTPIMALKKDFESKYQVSVPLKSFKKSLEDQGYYIHKNEVHNILPIIQKDQTEQTL